jgi:hypothetical protein
MILHHSSHTVKRGELQSAHPVTVAEFLRINPLPRQLRHLEKSLRKLPSVKMVFDVIIGCLVYDMGADDFTNIINAVGAMYSQSAQRCAGCFHWTPQFHAVIVGKVERYRAVPLCDACARRFEAGTETPQMQRNLSSYAGGAEVAK